MEERQKRMQAGAAAGAVDLSGRENNGGGDGVHGDGAAREVGQQLARDELA